MQRGMEVEIPLGQALARLKAITERSAAEFLSQIEGWSEKVATAVNEQHFAGKFSDDQRFEIITLANVDVANPTLLVF